MNHLIKAISEKRLDEAKEIFNEEVNSIVEKKMHEVKKMMMANEQDTMVRKAFDGNPGARAEKLYRGVTEEELEEARIAIVKARVRGGKVQRRKKVSNVSGYTLRGGQLTRMSVSERRNRKLGQRRGKIKRRAKLSRALMKRSRSLRKRQALGI